MPSIIDTLADSFRFHRHRTLGLLETIEGLPDPLAVLGWRPGPGRAHIGWQLMHIAVTEEIFATERLKPERHGEFVELWPRFRGGSTPDDDVPDPSTIRRVMEHSRGSLLATLAHFQDDQLESFKLTLRDRELCLLDVLHIIGWHEAHHQGQAHLTLNLYKAQAAA